MLTTSGRTVAVASLFLLVSGWALDYPELVMLGIAGAVALAVAAMWMLMRPTVSARREIRPYRVSEGERAAGVLTVTNSGRRRTAPILAIERFGDGAVEVRLPSLAMGQSTNMQYDLPTDHRRKFEVGPLTIGHSDPLRLMHVGQMFGARSTLLVHPRIHEVPPIPTGRSRDMDGPTSSTAPQGGIAFHSLREYVPGDDLRLIHWKSVVRTGELMVRHNVVTNEPRLMVVLDTSAAPYDETSFEEAVRVAASLCAAACRGGFPLTFRTTGGVVTGADRAGNGYIAVLDALAEVTTSDNDRGLAELTRMVPHETGVSLGVVTGQPDEHQVMGAAAVRPRFDMVSIVQVGERFDRPALPVRGAVALNVRTSEDFHAAWKRVVRT